MRGRTLGRGERDRGHRSGCDRSGSAREPGHARTAAPRANDAHADGSGARPCHGRVDVGACHQRLLARLRGRLGAPGCVSSVPARRAVGRHGWVAASLGRFARGCGCRARVAADVGHSGESVRGGECRVPRPVRGLVALRHRSVAATRRTRPSAHPRASSDALPPASPVRGADLARRRRGGRGGRSARS